jgi:hypothetical protein
MGEVADSGDPDKAIEELDKQFEDSFGPDDGPPVDETEGLLVLPSAMVSYYRRTIIRHANARKLRAVYPLNQFPRDGGLVSYGVPGDLRVDIMIQLVRNVLRVVRAGGKASDVGLVDLSSLLAPAVNETTADEQVNGDVLNAVLPTFPPSARSERTKRVEYLIDQSRVGERNPIPEGWDPRVWTPIGPP